jgi:hypothetical protein
MAVKVAKVAGLTTIYWGTKGLFNSPSGLASVIVEDCSITPKNAGPIGEIENGDGATVSAQFLDDGFDAKPKVVYDKNVTWPAVGDQVIINLPTIGAAGGVTSYGCILASIPPEVKRKQHATLEMTLIYRPGVDASTYTSVTNLA